MASNIRDIRLSVQDEDNQVYVLSQKNSISITDPRINTVSRGVDAQRGQDGIVVTSGWGEPIEVTCTLNDIDLDVSQYLYNLYDTRTKVELILEHVQGTTKGQKEVYREAVINQRPHILEHSEEKSTVDVIFHCADFEVVYGS